MLFDDVLRNPLLKKALAAGEEQAGRVVGRLLSSETVATGLQGLLSAASTARATLEAGLDQARKAANLPSAGEVQAMQQKIDELEALIDDLSTRLDAERRRDPASPGPSGGPPGGPAAE